MRMRKIIFITIILLIYSCSQSNQQKNKIIKECPLISNSSNLMICELNKKKGVVDSNSNIKIPFIYDYIGQMEEYGLCHVNKNDKWGLINTNGEIIIPIQFKHIRLIQFNIIMAMSKNDNWINSKRIKYYNFQGKKVDFIKMIKEKINLEVYSDYVFNDDFMQLNTILRDMSKYSFNGNQVYLKKNNKKISIENIEPFDSRIIVIDNNSFGVIYGSCMGSDVIKYDYMGNKLFSFFIKGHSHSIGILAKNRQILIVFDFEHYSEKNEKPTSLLRLFNWNTGKEIRVIEVGVIEPFDILAVDKREKFIYIGALDKLKKYEL